MDIARLKQRRADLHLTQPEMAEYMGMPFRSYQAIELEQNPARPIHLRAAQAAALAAFVDAPIDADRRLPRDVQIMVERAWRRLREANISPIDD